MAKFINIIILSVIITIAFAVNTTCYAQEYLVKSYPISQSIRGSKVMKIFQDNRGFLWFATNEGIFRFDGKNFINPEGLEVQITGSVMDILQDRNGNLLFSAVYGLYRYSGSGVRKIPTQTPVVQNTLEDRHGNLWAIITNKLYFIKDNKFQNLSEEAGIRKKKKPEIILDSVGDLLVITSQGIKKFINGSFNVDHRFDPVFNMDITSFFFDKTGRIWTGFKNGTIKSVFNNKVTTYSLPGDRFNRIISIAEDSRNNIWICSKEGLFRLNQTGFREIALSKDSLSKSVNTVFEDNEGHLWAGTNTGAYRLSRNEYFKLNEANKLDFNHVSSVTEDNSGNIWFGSNTNGLMIYDGIKFRIIKNSDGINLKTIYHIMQARNGSMWLTATDGLVRYKDGKFRLFGTADGLIGKHISNVIHEDDQGNIYFINDFRICKFDGEKFTYSANLRFENIRTIFKGVNGEMLLLSLNAVKDFNLKNRLVFKSDTILTHLRSNVVIIRMDKDGSLWLGISKIGFGRITKDGKFREIITSTDGLPDNYIRNMFIDSRNYLWIGTGSGISKFDLGEYLKSGRKIFRNFRNSENEVTNHVRTFFEDSKNNVWVGTTHGITKFPNNASDDHLIASPKVYLTGLKLFMQSFDYKAYSDSIEQYSGLPANLKLPYNRNYLSISFVGLNYSNPEAVQYKYKLNGFDSSWSPITKNNEVTYTNLPPGVYKFELKARNDNGLWSSKNAEITFTIKPPFWKTWWFYILCIAAGISVVLGYTKARTYQLQKQKLALEQTVSLRTRELLEEKLKVEDANQELERKRLQLSKINELQEKWLSDLSESERLLMESNDNKDKLFSMISHDLKSPFRSLLLFSETVQNKVDKMTSSEIKEYTSNVHKAAGNVYNLLENLLEWSRLQIGRIEINPVWFNIYNAAGDTIQVLEGNARRKEISVVNNIRPDMCIFADANTIRSVMNNLISNAIKFTNHGGVVRLESKEEKDFTEIAITDNGVGMNSSELSRLFRPDENFFKNGTDNEKGTGLGLILCKEMIEKNNGSIIVRSEPGKGSTFSFIIPVPG